MDLSDEFERFTHNGREYAARLERDDCHGAPWEWEDGHGPVTGWESRAKLPGELVLSEDNRGRARRFYDFAAACEIARREGWGFLPGRLIYDRFAHSGRRKYRAYVQNRRDLTAYGPDVNAAIRNLYATHRATMTPREYAARAARRDFERLRAWCNGDWCYVGVIVAPVCPCCGEIKESDAQMSVQSLWGIESDAGEYLEDVARELADELAAMSDIAA